MKSEQDILIEINKFTKKKFILSNVISDDYLLNQKHKISANGYGIYDNNKTFAKHRYCLIINLKNNGTKGTVVALLMNPSDTFPNGLNKNKKSKFDQTIRNIIKLVDKLGYKQLIVLNSFSYICSNGKEAVKYYEESFKNSGEEKINMKIIEYILNNSNELLVACGNGVPARLYKEYFGLVKKLKDNLIFLTYAKKLTTKKRPRHFSLQSPKNKYWFDNAWNKKILWQLKIKDSDNGFNEDNIVEIPY